MAIHGNKSQGARTKALADFKDGGVHVLVATDIAARGIDIAELPRVVNYDLPNVPEDYVHRIGRTGRAGADGEAISLVCVDEHGFLRDIERLIRRTLPRETVEGFEPDRNERAQPVFKQPRGRTHAHGAGTPHGHARTPGAPRGHGRPDTQGQRHRHAEARGSAPAHGQRSSSAGRPPAHAHAGARTGSPNGRRRTSR